MLLDAIQIMPASKKETIDFLADIIIKKNMKIMELERAIRIMTIQKITDKLEVKEVDPWLAYNPVLEAERILKNEQTK